MNSNFNLDKFLPSFGSEVLDAMYQETTIIDRTFDDFLNLPVRDDYKQTTKIDFEEVKTEEKKTEIIDGSVINEKED